jgi:hypothetical protein
MAVRCGSTSLIVAFKRLRQEDHKFKTSLGYKKYIIKERKLPV